MGKRDLVSPWLEPKFSTTSSSSSKGYLLQYGSKIHTVVQHRAMDWTVSLLYYLGEGSLCRTKWGSCGNLKLHRCTVHCSNSSINKHRNYVIVTLMLTAKMALDEYKLYDKYSKVLRNCTMLYYTGESEFH